MYKTVLSHGSVLFLGGMFNKKVRPGIYRNEFKAKFFENTREKLPSLRVGTKLSEVLNKLLKMSIIQQQSDE